MTASTPDLAALEAEMRARALEATPGLWRNDLSVTYIDPANVIAVLDGKDAEIASERARADETEVRIAELTAALEPFVEVANSYTVQTAPEGYVFTLRPRGSNRMTGLRREHLIRAARVLSAYRASEAERDGGSDV